ncbi:MULTISPECIES: FAD-dependent monooxygenase [Streptomyces]|uniref:FAD-dependent monooxygenase n=1 Tax=Streptomyces luteosporeus TaxID=173856 RepID=A0ABN3TMF0_9ACTN
MSEAQRGPGHAGERRAVVLGGSLAGMLAAAALAGHAGEVVVVERDALPEEVRPRKGLPQARHAHLLMSGGARAMESLLPGVTAGWLAAGGRRMPLPTALVSLSAQGWIPRTGELQYVIACSRDLLDLVVRERVRTLPGVRFVERTGVLGLTGDARQVTGVRLRDAASGEERSLAAAFVVDATGRASQAPRWLTRLGLPAVREVTVDSGLVYATRIFRAPPGSEDFPIVSVAPEPGTSRPGRAATLHPIEGGRWLVTLSGTRGGEPTAVNEEFEPFARTLRHPIIADLVAASEPLTDVRLTRSTVNRRRHFERLDAWPGGFVVTGDALAAFNPVYGHGMSVAALGAVALRGLLPDGGLTDPRLARRAQQAIARTAEAAWSMAVGEDVHYPGAIGERPPAAARLLRGYVQRMMRTATVDAVVTRALIDVMTLSRPLPAVFAPAVALRVLRGPTGAPPAGPPITSAELAVAGLTPADPAPR